MQTLARGIWVAMIGLLALVGPVWGDPGVNDSVPTRAVVIEVQKEKGLVRVLGESGRPMNLACQKGLLVVSEGGARGDLGSLNPGDMVRLETSTACPAKLVLLWQAWEELTSPER